MYPLFNPYNLFPYPLLRTRDAVQGLNYPELPCRIWGLASLGLQGLGVGKLGIRLGVRGLGLS